MLLADRLMRFLRQTVGKIFRERLTTPTSYKSFKVLDLHTLGDRMPDLLQVRDVLYGIKLLHMFGVDT